MTTEQRHNAIVRRAPAALALLVALLTGCATEPEFRLPSNLISPYQARGDVLWAVAPLRNESGTSAVNALELTDELARQIAEVRGVRVTPVNRTIAAMQALGMASVQSEQDALRLARAMEVDAVVVGVISDWDPYSPPRMGLSLGLFGFSPAMQAGSTPEPIDPRAIQFAPTDRDANEALRSAANQPLSTASLQVDGANHETQIALRAFAEGRHDPQSSLGWRVYIASMSLFTRFVCHEALEQMLDAERLRVARMSVATETP